MVVECFDKFFCEPVGILLCASMLSALCSKMMIEFMKDHEGIIKIFLVQYVDGLGLRNITPSCLTVSLWHTNFQAWNGNTVMMAQCFYCFNVLFHENHLDNLGFEQVLSVEHTVSSVSSSRYKFRRRYHHKS